jgi:hypothetical protein
VRDTCGERLATDSLSCPTTVSERSGGRSCGRRSASGRQAGSCALVSRDDFIAAFPPGLERLFEGASISLQQARPYPQQAQHRRRRHVVVLDNVARLTAPRLESIRRLRERFQIVVAIAEAFLSEERRQRAQGAVADCSTS